MSRISQLDIVRNIGIMAHIDAGKTTTTERILYYTGKVHRMGEVDDGSATMDWMEQEKERGITITSAVISCSWKRHLINIIDTPGHVDFTVEVERSLRILDGSVAIFCGVGGVEPQSETVWRQADKYHIPRVAFVNKLDRIGADFDRVIRMMRERLGVKPVAIQMPMGQGDQFTGIIDLIEMKALFYDAESLGSKWQEQEIPESYQEQAREQRAKIVEAISDQDDTLLAKYLDGVEPTVDEIKKNLRIATLRLALVPVMCGSALRNVGVQRLLDAIVDFLPSPVDIAPIEGVNPFTSKKEVRKPDIDAPFSALAFKIQSDPYVGRITFVRIYSGAIRAGDTVLNAVINKKERIARILHMAANKREDRDQASVGEIIGVIGLRHTKTGATISDLKHPLAIEQMVFPEPVISVAIEPRSKADEEKLSDALTSLVEEDPTFRVKVNEETGQTEISGMGELHLDIITDRLLREFKVQAKIGRPQVAFKETIQTQVVSEGRFIQQTGGRNHYGVVKLEIAPNSAGKGFEFENRTQPGLIPREFIRSIATGAQETMGSGPLRGYELIDIKATLIDGAYHPGDSTEMAFKIAAALAMREGVEKADPILLEPIMDLEVIVPEAHLGDVINDLNSRKANITHIEPRGDVQIINATVALRKMFGYATALRSASQGRALFTMQFSRYDKADADNEMLNSF